MVDVESNPSAAAQENWLRLPAKAKAAWEYSQEKDVEEDSEEEEEEEGDSDYEEEASSFRDTWNSLYSRYFGRFEDTTKVPNKRFTYKKPGKDHFACPRNSLQIFSVKVARIRGALQWPLHVFGKVAVRDAVDHNRNIIFDRRREYCQILTKEVPYLKLTGPTRAVVVVDPVTFEVDLKVKGATQSEDECLSSLAVTYIDFAPYYSRLVKRDYASKLSTVVFTLGSVVYSVEATIAVRVKSGFWLHGYRARFGVRTAGIGGAEAEVILLDSGDGIVPVALDGSIELSRCVASAQISREVEFCVKALRGGEIVVKKEKSFKPKKDGVSHATLGVGFCTLDVTIAWSLISLRI